jgi:hypothetical protein
MKNKFTLAQNLIGDEWHCEFYMVMSDSSLICLVKFMTFDDLHGDKLDNVRSIDGGLKALQALILKTFSVQIELK